MKMVARWCHANVPRLAKHFGECSVDATARVGHADDQLLRAPKESALDQSLPFRFPRKRRHNDANGRILVSLGALPWGGEETRAGVRASRRDRAGNTNVQKTPEGPQLGLAACHLSLSKRFFFLVPVVSKQLRADERRQVWKKGLKPTFLKKIDYKRSKKKRLALRRHSNKTGLF